MVSPLVQPFQDLLDRGVSASGEAMRLCRRLEGRSLRIDPQGMPVAVQFDAAGERLLVSVNPQGAADCTVSGLPLSMARLGIMGDADLLRSGALRMSGDPVLAQDFQRLLQLARPDWEEELARLVGDVAAHQVGNATRGLMRWGQQATETLRRDVAEFLTEESRDLPSRFEVDEFLDGVDCLRSDVERVAVRLGRLEERARGSRE